MTALSGSEGRATNPPRGEVRTWLVTSPHEMADVYHIRHEVFVLEQGFARDVRDNPDDRFSSHVLAEVDGQVVGTGRVTFYGDEAQIVWVAVLKPYRNRGVGRAVMEHLLRLCDEQGSQLISLNAQTHALRFYESLGFEPVGRRFYMANIEHQCMVRLQPNREAS